MSIVLKILILVFVNIGFLTYAIIEDSYHFKDESIYGKFGVAKGASKDQYDERMKAFFFAA